MKNSLLRLVRTGVEVDGDKKLTSSFCRRRLFIHYDFDEASVDDTLETRRYKFQPPTPTLSATMHSVTNGRKDHSIMTIADHTVCSSTIG